MNRFKKILVAFDGSYDSINALKRAETLANDNQADLTVAYVHDRLENQNGQQAASTIDILSKTYVGPGPMPTRTLTNTNQGRKETVTSDQVISSAKNVLSNETNVNYKIFIGKPASELTSYANHNHIDLIVIGNRGLNGIKRFVIESVSQKVTNQAKCPVLVMK